MKDWKNWYRLGAWLFLFLGSAHSLSTFLSLRRPLTDPSLTLVIGHMKSVSPPLPTSHSLWDFHIGFSYMMGCLIIAFGIQALLSMSCLEKSKALCLLNIGLSLGMCLLSLRYFFMFPVIISGLATLAFTLAYKLKRDHTHP